MVRILFRPLTVYNYCIIVTMSGDEGGDVWDSWEDMVDSGGLEKRLEKEEQTLQETRKKGDASNSQPIVLEEDTHRTKYQPTIKLMKRDNDDGEEKLDTDISEVNKEMTKTLAERQEEYAQARLRILGSAKNEEDEEEIKRTKEPSKTRKAVSITNKPSNNNSTSSNNVNKTKGKKNKSKKGSSGKR